MTAFLLTQYQEESDQLVSYRVQVGCPKARADSVCTGALPLHVSNQHGYNLFSAIKHGAAAETQLTELNM